MTSTCMPSPIPVPSTSIASDTQTNPLDRSKVDKSSNPQTVTAAPPTWRTSDPPVRPTTVPESIDAASSPSTIGSIRNPDSVAELPFTTCRYIGRNVIAPNIANPVMKLSSPDTANTREPNSRIG